jgi:hypothetical protein
MPNPIMVDFLLLFKMAPEALSKVPGDGVHDSQIFQISS